PDVDVAGHGFVLKTAPGHERKTTGSYYTPTSLINLLLESALDPVLDEASKKPDPEKAVLALKICDPACGSGHFLIAAAHRVAHRLASVRTGDAEASPEAIRHAVRDVIGHCIYGVDVNEMAVELCKVGLWMEALEPGKPLSFLDHRIVCGNSLLGTTPALMARGIPDEAFEPIAGDDKKIASAWKKRNKQERQGQMTLDLEGSHEVTQSIQDCFALLNSVEDDSIDKVHLKEEELRHCHTSERFRLAKLRADAWCAAFVWRKRADGPPPITFEVFRRLMGKQVLPSATQQEVEQVAGRHSFLHWHLAFPDVFRMPKAGETAHEIGGWVGGFDVVLGNPPWERIKLQEEEHWADVPEIAGAQNQAARRRKIEEWRNSGDSLKEGRVRRFEEARREAEAESQLVRKSGRFPLTAVGDVNTYALFCETFRALTARSGRAGIVVPVGIATDDTCKDFFAALVRSETVCTLIGFENEAFIFPAVHNAFKFCALTFTGGNVVVEARYAFLIRRFAQLADHQRFFSLTSDDVALINPNTLTCPIFRTSYDSELTKRIYGRVPILINDRDEQSPWRLRFNAMIHMASDSSLFRYTPAPGYVPLIEGKMIHQYDHRFASYQDRGSDRGVSRLPEVSEESHRDPNFQPIPYYYVPKDAVLERLNRWPFEWLVGFRDVSSAVNERTAIATVVPAVGVGHTLPLIMPDRPLSPLLIACLLANFNSMIFDYVARQKQGGMHLTYHILKQLPMLPPSAYGDSELEEIIPTVLELTYTSHDLRSFADDIWCNASELLRKRLEQQWIDSCREMQVGHGSPVDVIQNEVFPFAPFVWGNTRRSRLRAHLDAVFAHLYGLEETELRYVLDPASVFGESFPGQTFRVYKENEIRRFGNYRTADLVLDSFRQIRQRETVPR
ncbi:MAG: Eco57I restriction-modification methylase domain-containing protein, partial [Sulfobacillus sp.]